MMLRLRWPILALCTGLLLTASPLLLAGDKPLELVDLMKMRQIESPSISEDGRWVAYALEPDRGDGEAVARSTSGPTEVRIERGSDPVLSSDGRWLAALVQPPLVERLKAEESKNDKKGNGGKKDDEGPKTGLAVVPLSATDSESIVGDRERIDAERVEDFAFSGDGRWIAWKHFKEEEEKDEKKEDEETEEPEEGEAVASEEPQTVEGTAPETPGTEETPEVPQPGEETSEEVPPAEEASEEEDDKEKKDERVGATLVLHRLADATRIEIPHVESYAFDETGAFLAYATAAPGGEGNGIFIRDLREDAAPEIELRSEPRGRYTALAWTHEDVAQSVFAFVSAVDDEDGEPGDASVWVWEGPVRTGRSVAASELVGEGWFVPSVNTLTFSRDGQRLFFGRKPVDEKWEKDEEEGVAGDEKEEGEGEEEEPIDPYDLDALVEKRELTVWHGDDPLIQTHQKQRWEDVKDRTYTAVIHLGDVENDGGEDGDDRIVLLADTEVREVEPSDNPGSTLGIAADPWFKERTWEGFFSDVYRVSLDDGSRQLVARKLSDDASLSPDGRWVLYYQDAHWHLFDGTSGTARNLTEGLPVSFANEDHDYPSPPPGYSVGGWVQEEGGEVTAVLVTDKFDIWQLPTDPADDSLNLTAGLGREEQVLYRPVELDPEQQALAPGERLLLTEYHDRAKSWGFATARIGEEGIATLVHEPKKFSFVAKAKNADTILFTRESYTEFPDLRVAPLDLEALGRRQPLRSGGTKISDANPQIADFAWGKPELVEWSTVDGVPLQGVLIKPGGYKRGRKVPVLVYYYRFFSQRLHEFNEPVVNHRPSFPFWASHGYAVFLPDIRFEVGRPGRAAVKSLVSGIHKLIAMGIADPDAVGLHGHSWSGYQTAFVITRTNLFKAAVAGAPVSNMTSAYSGIRLRSGLARQFQYEKSQSRIGGSLWEARSLYIENSPVFYADRIQTPLLIQFGDEDGAVPWQQGIELYLAMRRLGKDVVFLQYEGEPHHLQKYANKVDYTIKMMEFFDHHLKGEPAPEWMTEGVPYRGE